MPVARTELELKLLHTLKRIASYDTPKRMRKRSFKDWGCEFEECIEMAYENIQHEARTAIRGVRVVRPARVRPDTHVGMGGAPATAE